MIKPVHKAERESCSGKNIALPAATIALSSTNAEFMEQDSTCVYMEQRRLNVIVLALKKTS